MYVDSVVEWCVFFLRMQGFAGFIVDVVVAIGLFFAVFSRAYVVSIFRICLSPLNWKASTWRSLASVRWAVSRP